MDGDGYPHISYFDETRREVKYAYQDAAGWHIEDVASGADDPATPTSLVLDGDGYRTLSTREGVGGLAHLSTV
jgi:hypothetical protein